MPASALTMRAITRESIFQDRITFLAVKAAIAVMAELNTVTNHAERVVYAKKILDGSANMDLYTLAVATNSTIQNEATQTPADGFNVPDADIEFAVNSLFDAMAGVAT